MDAKTPIKAGETEFCILCARDHGEMNLALCRVYSFGYAAKIPVCCHCCMTQLQDMSPLLAAGLFYIN